MTIQEKEEMLLKSNYSTADIMKLLNCKRTKASNVMKDIRMNYDGAIVGRPYVVKAKSFWEREGSSIEAELSIIANVKLHERNIQN